MDFVYVEFKHMANQKRTDRFYVPQASSKRQHHLNKHLYRPSTFLTSYEPPVYMDEDDERSVYYSSMHDPSGEESVS